MQDGALVYSETHGSALLVLMTSGSHPGIAAQRRARSVGEPRICARFMQGGGGGPVWVGVMAGAESQGGGVEEGTAVLRVCEWLSTGYRV